MVWFKQLQAFHFNPPKGKTPDDLQQALQKQKISSCPPGTAMTYGWQSPLGDASQTLVVSAGAGHCAQFSVAKRLLPLDVIRQTVAERVAQQEQEQGIAVSKRERKRMLEEAHFELLPKAFVQKKSCTVLWDWENQMMYVSTAQQGLLDHLNASLAFCLPGWMIKLCKLEQNIERTLTGWLKEDTVLPSEMQWGEACQLADPKDRFCSIRFAGNELQSQSVRQHLQEGMWVKQAQLQWQERMRFVLNPNFTLSQMKYLDLERAEADAESPQAQLESDIAVLVPTYTALIQWLADAFGGMVVPKSTTTVDSEVLVQPFESMSEA
jgi:recombination associated protein RdgC